MAWLALVLLEARRTGYAKVLEGGSARCDSAVLATLISAAASSFRPFAHGGLASFMLGCLLYGLVYVLLEWLIGMNAYEKGLVRLCLGKARLHF